MKIRTIARWTLSAPLDSAASIRGVCRTWTVSSGSTSQLLVQQLSRSFSPTLQLFSYTKPLPRKTCVCDRKSVSPGRWSARRSSHRRKSKNG